MGNRRFEPFAAVRPGSRCMRGSGGLSHASIHSYFYPLSPSPPSSPLSSPHFPQVESVAVLRHPNIVRLYGYCAEMAATGEFMEQILVYEFVPNGDLAGFMKKGE